MARDVSFVETSRQYDDFGNETQSTTSVQGGETRTTSATYINDDDAWLIQLPFTRAVTSMGHTRSVRFGHDASGHLQTVKMQPDDVDPSVRSTTYRVRDDRGLVIQVAEEAPSVAVRVTNLYHDPDHVFVAQVTNPAGHQSTVLRHAALGVPVLTQDALGVVSLAKYDGFGRLDSTDGPTDFDIDHVSYAPFNNPSGETIGIETTTHLTDGSAQSVSTDEVGRAVRSAVRGFDGGMLHAATHYNLFGQMVSVTRMANGAPSGLMTDIVYDTLGRVLLHSPPDDVQTVMEYDPFETRTIDALGHERRVLYDPHHRPMQSEEEIVENGQTKTLTTTFHYGEFGLVKTSTDPSGRTITIRYDGLGRKVHIDDPDAGATDFSYNGLGELVSRMTPEGKTISIGHDSLSRPVWVNDSDGTTMYVWDMAPNGIGQLAFAFSPDSVATHYEYDALGRRTTSHTLLDGTESFAVDFDYDTFGRLSAIEYPADPSGQRFTVSFEHNMHGYPKSVTRTTLAQGGSPPMQLVWATLERDESLALTKGMFGDDIITTWQRDPATGMVEKITAEPSIAVIGAPPKLQIDYFYDALRNVKTREWSGSAFGAETITESFDHDVLDRLTEWQVSGPVSGGSGTRKYDYDTMGNLTGVLLDGQTIYQATYGWNQLPNALASSSLSNDFEYDAAGRQTRAGDREVIYTDFDLPRSVTVSGVATDFRYGPGRGRVEKTGPNGRTVYVGGLYEKRETPDATEHVFFVPGDGGIAAQVTRTVTGSVVTEDIVYFTRDHLGSSSAAFDQNGDAEVQVFDPWGERIYHGGASGALMSAVHHGYTDQRHEDDLGWIDMNARMYDPAQRRFISADPLVADPLFSTGRNRFAYVLNNPLRYTDPTGLSGVVTQHNTWDHNAVRNDTTGATVTSSASFPDDSVSVPYGLNLPGYTWPVFQPAPFEQAPAETRPSNGPTGAESSTEVHATVASPSDRMLNTRFAMQGGMKDWVDIDPDAVDHRGRALYDCDSPTNCKSIAANYIEPPIGTSDVEVYLAAGGTGKIVGGAWRGLAKLLQRAAPVAGPMLEAEVTAGALATEATGTMPLALPPARAPELGGGRTFSHFTDAGGATGITGIVASELEVGQQVILGQLRFTQGSNQFLASSAGRIFITELGLDASSGALNQIGVFGPKQQFVIQLSEEAAFTQGARIIGEVPARSIYSMPGGVSINGQFTLTRVR